jgi:GTP-binding protein
VLLANAQFLAAAESVADLPRDTRAEVAFVGRSNSGKSSAINALTGRRRLARVSRTPGRTRQINLFSVGERAAVVDLPGYGYSRVSQQTRSTWSRTVTEYLRLRPQLVGLVLVMDARHPLTALDRQLLAWIKPTGKPLQILLSKADKLTRAQAVRVLATTRAQLLEAGADATVELFSSLTRQGAEAVAERIARWLGQQNKKTPG